jgi:hypothetical protein
VGSAPQLQSFTKSSVGGVRPGCAGRKIHRICDTAFVLRSPWVTLGRVNSGTRKDSQLDKEEVHRLLTDSPWARPVRLSFDLTAPRSRESLAFSDIGLPPGIGLPRGGGMPGTGWPGGVGLPGGGRRDPGGGGGSVRAEAYLTIRWSSALPMKQAALLDRLGYDLRDSDEASGVNGEKSQYVVGLRPAGHRGAHGDGQSGTRTGTERLTSPERAPPFPSNRESPTKHLALTFRFPNRRNCGRDNGGALVGLIHSSFGRDSSSAPCSTKGVWRCEHHGSSA